MKNKYWDNAVTLRGRSFARNLETYKMLTRLKPPKNAFDEHGKEVVSYLANRGDSYLQAVFFNDGKKFER